MGTVTFTDMTFLVLTGSLPSPQQRDLLDAVLVSVMDHGIAPSILLARMLASFGVPLQVGIAGGTLSFGDWHGGACEAVAVMLSGLVAEASTLDDGAQEHLRTQVRQLVREKRSDGQRIEGFGHPLHPQGDTRTERLFELARELDLFGRHCHALHLLEEELSEQLDRRLPINIDGAIAATILDLGFPWQASRCFLITPRTVGMTAHFLEELAQGGRWRHASDATVRYTGPAVQVPPDQGQPTSEQ